MVEIKKKAKEKKVDVLVESKQVKINPSWTTQTNIPTRLWLGLMVEVKKLRDEVGDLKNAANPKKRKVKGNDTQRA